MTRLNRPNPYNIVYESGMAVIKDEEINPSMNDSIISDGEGPIVGLGSIVSDNQNSGEIFKPNGVNKYAVDSFVGGSMIRDADLDVPSPA